MPDLTPFDPQDLPEGTDEPKSGYLLMAGILCGLIIAFGSQALRGHFQTRPELAQADPLMVAVITWAFYLGWVLAGGSLAVFLWALSNKNSVK